MRTIVSTIGILYILALCYSLFPSRRLNRRILADKIVVRKGARKLELWSGGKKVKTYRIALGKNPVGAKQFEGDMRTPEGTYIIDGKNPNSAFYLNLGISYPDNKAMALAEAMGKKPGSAIKIHGLRNGLGWRGRFHRTKDWTAGCIAVTNIEMEELYRAVPVGTPIHVYS